MKIKQWLHPIMASMNQIWPYKSFWIEIEKSQNVL
jgi:hypothetical protein